MRKECVIIGFVFLTILLSSIFVSANVVKVSLDGKEYNVSIRLLTAESVSFQVNDQLSKKLNKQNSPYQFYPYYQAEKIGNLDLIVDGIYYQAYVGGKHDASVILAYRVNVSEECIEDWTCTNWSACSNNQETRACTDSNICGTILNKPLETQSCSSPTPVIECYSDEDCFMESTGSPYCENNSVCLDSATYECMNDGTEESYCKSTPTKSCVICSDGCSNKQCINGTSPTPSPTKECEQIGVRQSGKYCSTGYKLVTQKLNSVSCENNFECKTNICTESKCASKIIPPSPNNNVIWVILGIAGAIVVIVVILFFVLRKRE